MNWSPTKAESFYYFAKKDVDILGQTAFFYKNAKQRIYGISNLFTDVIYKDGVYEFYPNKTFWVNLPTQEQGYYALALKHFQNKELNENDRKGRWLIMINYLFNQIKLRENKPFAVSFYIEKIKSFFGIKKMSDKDYRNRIFWPILERLKAAEIINFDKKENRKILDKNNKLIGYRLIITRRRLKELETDILKKTKNTIQEQIQEQTKEQIQEQTKEQIQEQIQEQNIKKICPKCKKPIPSGLDKCLNCEV